MKTIDEAAKEYAKELSSSEVFQIQHGKDFKAGVEFAQRWIPVSEDLPKYETEFDSNFPVPILVLNENYGMCSSAIYKNNSFIIDNPVINPSDITHWRPIELK